MYNYEPVAKLNDCKTPQPKSLRTVQINSIRFFITYNWGTEVRRLHRILNIKISIQFLVMFPRDIRNSTVPGKITGILYYNEGYNYRNLLIHLDVRQV